MKTILKLIALLALPVGLLCAFLLQWDIATLEPANANEETVRKKIDEFPSGLSVEDLEKPFCQLLYRGRRLSEEGCITSETAITLKRGLYNKYIPPFLSEFRSTIDADDWYKLLIFGNTRKIRFFVMRIKAIEADDAAFRSAEYPDWLFLKNGLRNNMAQCFMDPRGYFSDYKEYKAVHRVYSDLCTTKDMYATPPQLIKRGDW